MAITVDHREGWLLPCLVVAFVLCVSSLPVIDFGFKSYKVVDATVLAKSHTVNNKGSEWFTLLLMVDDTRMRASVWQDVWNSVKDGQRVRAVVSASMIFGERHVESVALHSEAAG